MLFLPEVKLRSWARILGLIVFALAVACFTAETASLFLYRAVHGEPFSREALVRRVAERQAESENDPNRPGAPRFVLHPYAGFVNNRYNEEINGHGYFGPDPITTRDPSRLNIVFTGGSVTRYLYSLSVDRFLEVLSRDPRYAGKTIVPVNLSMRGYKQPQQLLTLQEKIALGAQYDIVINLDGFNEVVLPYTESFPQGISFHYPRGWGYFADAQFRVEKRRILKQMRELRAVMDWSNGTVLRSPWRYSVTALFVWDLLDRYFQRRMYTLQRVLERPLKEKEGRPAQEVAGPYGEYDREEVLEQSMQLWAESSLQMAKLCAANGIRYYHFLQPNLYLEDAKHAYTPEEAALLQGDHNGTVAEAVARSYPVLRQVGEKLERLGVSFTDLTMIFAERTEHVFYDDCCHFTLDGNDLIAEAIARRILRDA